MLEEAFAYAPVCEEIDMALDIEALAPLSDPPSGVALQTIRVWMLHLLCFLLPITCVVFAVTAPHPWYGAWPWLLVVIVSIALDMRSPDEHRQPLPTLPGWPFDGVLYALAALQLVNVALGGDLVSHIPDHFGEKVVHRHPELRPVEHPVRIEPGSRLASILGVTELSVHSVHHQAVGRLGDGLRAAAWSPDGVIEAIESERHPFLIGVQWHPELGALDDERQRRLFEALIAHRRRRRPAREPEPQRAFS